MDTVTNAASQAAKVVGHDNIEPISGAAGNVSRGEPYDAGNMASSEQHRLSMDMCRADQAHKSTPRLPQKKEITIGQYDKNGPLNVERCQSRHNESHSGNVVETGNSGANKEGEIEQGKQTEDNTQPNGGPAIMSDGPRPLQIVAKEQGGNASNIKTEFPGISSKNETDENMAMQDKDNSGTKGTGEQYVMTTGFAADGGNFDATRPGAGREADRLMEAKCMSSLPSSHGQHSGKDKPSLGERFKHKLHKP